MYSKFEKLMLEKGLSANRIAKEAGINAPSLTYWKQGKYTPSLKTVFVAFRMACVMVFTLRTALC